MENPKKILILSADAGFGHKKAALAVQQALTETYGDRVEIIMANPMEDKRTPFFIRDSPADYDRIVKAMPELYRVGYDASDANVTTKILESAMTVLMYEVMSDLIEKVRPDAILCTYPIYIAPLAAIFTIERTSIPCFAVVTDLATVHRIWFNHNLDACFVPNQAVRNQAIASNLPPRKVITTGIPVNPIVAKETRSKPEIRQSLGWSPDLFTLLAVGSKRVEHLLDALNVINHFGSPLQLAVVAGNDKDLYKKLTEVDWHIPVHLFDYIEDVPSLMHASDGIICKAGGLIITESLACKLPIMIIDVIAGQETGNATFITNSGAGDLAVSPMEVMETLSHWLKDDKKLLNLRAENSAHLGRPNSAYAVADLLWQAANTPLMPKGRKHIFGRPTLMALLNRYKIPWQERHHHNED